MRECSRMSRTARNLISLVFPSTCCGCRCEISPETTDRSRMQVDDRSESAAEPSFFEWQSYQWCDECWIRIQPVRGSTACVRCGAFLQRPSPYPDGCWLCHGADWRIRQALAAGNYQGLLQELIIQMKGQRDDSLAYQLGCLLGYRLLETGWTGFDMISVVPTHWWKRFRKAFHASEIIGEAVSEITGIRKRNLVRAIRATRKQGTLSNRGRIANVRHAFSPIDKLKLDGANVLIVDDVMTSGATVNEIARVLRRAGARSVSAAVVARGARVS